MVDENEDSWGDVAPLIINLSSSESAVEDMGDYTTLPVLQDTSSAGVADAYGAHGKYIYILDADGNPSYIHYGADFDSDRERILEEIAVLTGGAR